MNRSEFSSKIVTLLNTMQNDGLSPVIDYTLRSQAEQQRLWAKGRQQMPDGTWVVSNASEIVTKVDGIKVQSKHQAGLAMDVYFVVDNSIDFGYETQEAKDACEHYHNIWQGMGGRALIVFEGGVADRSHYEG